ncbi:MAG: TetR/AcrR family transcriptional regulator, ethionamide resistance regulator [Solirubrobacteraceae bacterium]|nr:TetR/AcrR family transcriptional regulator, ethionamide resistance regulator [Solirubrobacteraceae bacterium]
MATTPRRAAVQAEVLSATEKLLAEGASWSDLGIERIATTAGISRTAFYFYFRDKRELLIRLTEDVTELLYLEADRWYSGEGDDETEIREALTKIAELYDEHSALLRIIVEVSTYDEEVAIFWRTLMGRFVEATRMRIEAEQTAGKAPAYAAAPAAFALVWMVERLLYQLMVQEPPFSRDEAIDAVVRLWMRAVYG